MRCGRTEEEVRLFDGIYVAEPVKICEKCSLMAGIPIVKRPNSDQIKNSDKPEGVRQRLMRLNKLALPEKKVVTIYEEIDKIEKSPQLERPENIRVKLVDNFHWIIKTERRRRGYSARQVSDILHESEDAINRIEKGIAPDKSLEIIKKLEQFFNVRLTKLQPEEVILKETVQLRTPGWVKRMQNKDSYEQKMREEEGNDMVQQAILEEKDPIVLDKEEVEGRPLDVLNFRKSSSNNPTILELRRVQRIIEQDSPKKTAFETGEEQMKGFGKEDTEHIKKTIFKEEEKKKAGVPTIYDLMKKKEEREKGLE